MNRFERRRRDAISRSVHFVRGTRFPPMPSITILSKDARRTLVALLLTWAEACKQNGQFGDTPAWRVAAHAYTLCRTGLAQLQLDEDGDNFRVAIPDDLHIEWVQ